MTSPATSEWTAKIVEWNRAKGYGFLQVGEKRVFLHRRDLVGPHLTPAVGDEIRFDLGHDEQGRPCAVNAVNAKSGLGVSLMSLLLLGALLVPPVIAGQRLGVDLQWLGAVGVTVSALTYGMYASDKRRARTGKWRVPESHLHFLEMIGGWPGAWLAQRRLRHKCSKGSYQVVFSLIVLAWQFASFDSLQDWEFSRAAQKRIVAMTERIASDLPRDPKLRRDPKDRDSFTE